MGEILSPEGEETAAAAISRPLAALRHRDFRLYWMGELVSLTGTEIMLATLAWQIYVLSHSAAALGLMGLFRVLPIIMFSLWGGVIADAVSRLRLLLVTAISFLILSGILSVATFSGTIHLWLIYVVITVAGAGVAFQSPATQALVPTLVPPAGLANALSLYTTVWQVATVLGPSIAGLIIANSGVGLAYLLDVISFLPLIGVLLVIRPPPVPASLEGISWRAALEGVRFVRHTPLILAAMGLDFVVTFFGSATALLPIFARDILHVGPQGYGLLYAAPACGAIVAGVIMTVCGHRIRARGWVILIAVASYALCTVVFGASRWFLVSMLALAGVGAADTVSMILRQTLRQTLTPDRLRGRMTSVNMVFFMGGPQLGEFEAGMVARYLGAPFSVISGGLAALVATIGIVGYATSLRRYRAP